MFAWLAVAIGLARLPEGIGWGHVAGRGLHAGICFTLSLFIDEFAFGHRAELREAAKMAILFASVFAAAAGWGLLRALPRRS